MRARVIGAPYHLANPAGTVEERFVATGNNTGNLLIGDGLIRIVDATITGQGTSIDPNKAEADNDLILIAAANFLHSAFDFSWMADFLEKVRLPVLIAGLGAQAPNFDSVPTLPEGTLRMLKIVSERCKTISVRGYYTAEVMDRLGFKNVCVTGCPSILRGLWPDIKMKPLPTDRPWRVIANGSRNVVSHSTSVERAISAERQILELSKDNGWPYVLQSEFPEFYFALGGSTPQHFAQIAAIAKSMSLNMSADDYAHFIRTLGRVFFRLDDWKSYVGEFDLSIGSRFHGNVMALSQGTPAVVIVHDSRTKEMCELLHAPHVQVTDIDRIGVRELAMAADFNGFRKQLPRLYANFAAYFDTNGVPHRLHHAVSTDPQQSQLTTGGRIRL